MEKYKKITYTCPKCGHRWRRNQRIFEGGLLNEDENQERLCTAHDKIRSALKHERTAMLLRTQAREMLSRRTRKEVDPT